MRIFRFDLFDLHLITLAADLGNLTSTAATLNLSLPAASRRIRSVEQRIGATLFERSNNGLLLTATGADFVEEARGILSRATGLLARLEASRATERIKLSLYANALAMTEFIPPAILAFLKRNPQIDLNLQEAIRAEAEPALVSQAIDLAIVVGKSHVPGIRSLPYRNGHVALVAPQGHPLAQAGTIAFVDTLQFDHVSMHTQNTIASFMNGICAKLGRYPRIRMQASSIELACSMVANNLGVGILPEESARRYAAHLPLEIVPLSDPWAVREMFICTLEHPPPHICELIDLLLALRPGMPSGIPSSAQAPQ